MTSKFSTNELLLGLVLGCMVLIGGCSSAVGNPQLLHGTWQASDQDQMVAWTFRPDGTFVFRGQPQNAWINALSGTAEIQGRWRLVGEQLTVEIESTPAPAAFWGGNWQGQTNLFELQKLSSDELQFAGENVIYRKSLTP